MRATQQDHATRKARLFVISHVPPTVAARVIAVDGPAASGKGTIARALAHHYGLPHMDTGALYRAVALRLLQEQSECGSTPENAQNAQDESLQATKVARTLAQAGQCDAANPDLRRPEVSTTASRIAAYPAVRAALLDWQRQFASHGGVLDGRDIGTVIAPWAPAKLFVTARADVRAARRLAELQATLQAGTREGDIQGHDMARVRADIARRDARDSQRTDAPLQRAEGALLLDTSDLTIDEAVQRAIAFTDDRFRQSRTP